MLLGDAGERVARSDAVRPHEALAVGDRRVDRDRLDDRAVVEDRNRLLVGLWCSSRAGIDVLAVVDGTEGLVVALIDRALRLTLRHDRARGEAGCGAVPDRAADRSPRRCGAERGGAADRRGEGNEPDDEHRHHAIRPEPRDEAPAVASAGPRDERATRVRRPGRERSPDRWFERDPNRLDGERQRRGGDDGLALEAGRPMRARGEPADGIRGRKAVTLDG